MGISQGGDADRSFSTAAASGSLVCNNGCGFWCRDLGRDKGGHFLVERRRCFNLQWRAFSRKRTMRPFDSDTRHWQNNSQGGNSQ
jgi:hypothetical protein